MSEQLIPQDIKYWLRELASGVMADPNAYEVYVRTVSARLYEKYCILNDPTLHVFNS
jgi:hypothetical protein